MNEVEQVNGYERYNGWIDKIKEMCNDENVVGFEKHYRRYFVHHIIDKRLHVYIAIVKENYEPEICISDIQIPKIRTYDNQDTRSVVRTTKDETIAINTGKLKEGGNIKYCPIKCNFRSRYNLPADLNNPRFIKGLSQEYYGEIPGDVIQLLRDAIKYAENDETRKVYEDAIRLHDIIRDIVEERTNPEEKKQSEVLENDEPHPEIVIELEDKGGFEEYSRWSQWLEKMCDDTHKAEPMEFAEYDYFRGGTNYQHYILANGLHVYRRDGDFIISDGKLDKYALNSHLRISDKMVRLQAENSQIVITYTPEGSTLNSYTFLPTNAEEQTIHSYQNGAYTEYENLTTGVGELLDDAMNNSQVIKTRDLYQKTRQFYQKVANTVKQVSKGEDIPQDKNTEILDLPPEQLQERLARLKEENQRMQAQLDEQARAEIQQAIKENERLKAELLEKSKKHR